MPSDKGFAGDARMTCEEFAMASLDLDSSPADGPLQHAAREHLRTCAYCAALHENWQTLHADLHLLGSETAETQAPTRVEMRLRQEFRTKHRTMKTRRAAATAFWALTAAAVLVAAMSVVRWHVEQRRFANSRQVPTLSRPPLQEPEGGSATGAQLEETVVASNDSGEFTLLPDSMPSPTADATVVHVEMQRAALGALGLTVNEEHAGDWIQVDLLVGDDGLPQAVRLPRDAN